MTMFNASEPGPLGLSSEGKTDKQTGDFNTSRSAISFAARWCPAQSNEFYMELQLPAFLSLRLGLRFRFRC